MAERIEIPQMPRGNNDEQMRQIYSYLYRLAQTMNNNMEEMGGMDLTDDERQVMSGILPDGSGKREDNQDSLKTLLVKTTEYVKKQLKGTKAELISDSVKSGQFGRYVRKTEVQAEVTPDGDKKTFTFDRLVQGLKSESINLKSYIKAGLLRTEGDDPVYGVAIGKDIVTFAEDGTETYNDGNKVIEIREDRIGFWYDGTEVFYIDEGTVNGDLTGDVTGNVTGNLTGDVTGKVNNRTTTATDMNSITDTGSYWLAMSGMSNKPSDISSGNAMLEVNNDGSGLIIQKLFISGAMYFRIKESSWGSWAKVEGETV